ncbi:MAG: hypothetical protein AAGI66_01060 [Cyanobacteria bacterium P01_H01_bin.74]
MTQKKQHLWKKFALYALFTLLGGFTGFLFVTFTELGPQGIQSVWSAFTGQKKPADIQFSENSSFSIKKQASLFNARVTRVINSAYAQEFLIFDQLPPIFFDQLIANKTTPLPVQWLSSVANECLKLRTANDFLNRQNGQIEKKSLPDPTIQVQKSTPVTKQILFIERNGKTGKKTMKVPVWVFDIQFKLSTDTYSRFYRFAVVSSSEISNKTQSQTIVTFAPTAAFNLTPLKNLIKALN